MKLERLRKNLVGIKNKNFKNKGKIKPDWKAFNGRRVKREKKKRAKGNTEVLGLTLSEVLGGTAAVVEKNNTKSIVDMDRLFI